MDMDTARRLLTEAGFRVQSENRLRNGYGTQLRLENGAIVNVYDRGTYNVQGKNTEDVKSLLDGYTDEGSSSPSHLNREVFVVYGHDQAAKTQLEALLRRWNLTPLFLDQLPSEGQTVIEKLEKYTGQAQYAIVLATPDDEGHRTGQPDEKAFRVRQNVVLELGMVLARLGRSRVAILLKGQHTMERPSDIGGLIYIPFDSNVEETRVPLAQEMNKSGYNIPVSAL